MIAMRPNPQAETRHSATPALRAVSDVAAGATLGAFVEPGARLCAVGQGEHLERNEADEDGGEGDHGYIIDLCALQR
jgi:hypothetical protein